MPGREKRITFFFPILYIRSWILGNHLIYPAFTGIMPVLIALTVPVNAAQDEDTLRQVSNMSLNVPQKGNAPLSSRESMTQMVDWLNESADVLLSFFQGIMDIFGLGNMSYTQQMTDILNQGINLSGAISQR